jgi:hypothetical protein
MTQRDDRPHKIMTPEEYAVLRIVGWHRVCKDVDGFGGVGIQYESADEQLGKPARSFDETQSAMSVIKDAFRGE